MKINDLGYNWQHFQRRLRILPAQCTINLFLATREVSSCAELPGGWRIMQDLRYSGHLRLEMQEIPAQQTSVEDLALAVRTKAFFYAMEGVRSYLEAHQCLSQTRR
jgi:hypothetical protein